MERIVLPSESSTNDSDYVNIIAIVVPPAVFYAAALVMFSLRIYTRASASGLLLDDVFLAMSVVLATALLIFASLAVHYGLGRTYSTLSPFQQSMIARMVMAIAESWNWGTTALKLSITALIVRIMGDRAAWRRSLYAFSAFLLVLAVTSSVWDLTTCFPIQANWNYSYSRTHCRSQHTGVIYLFVGGVFYMLTDIVLAMLPLFFILKLNRPLRERIVLCVLLALGILCAAASIPKFIVYAKLLHGDDRPGDSVAIMVWSQLELYIGIAATSTSVLRTMLESTLRRIGFSLSNTARGFTSRSWSRTHGLPETIEMGSSVPKQSKNSRREHDSESCEELATSWEGKDGIGTGTVGFGNEAIAVRDYYHPNS